MAKQTKKTTVKKTKKVAPVMEHKCSCGADCSCHKHGDVMHLIRQIIVLAIIFVLGIACGKVMNCQHHCKKMVPHINPVFVDGCLKMKSIKCPKMLAEVVKADVNGDGCISRQEYGVFKAVNKKFRKNMRDSRK